MQNIYEKHRYAQISEDEAHKRLDILEPNWKESNSESIRPGEK